LKTSKTMQVIAWGQYIHWAQLQFERYSAIDPDISDSEKIGITAHWLSAERVVLEGWNEIGFVDNKISDLIRLYPENCESLRLCRNAVYHFQSKILDERILKFMRDENEEFAWLFALHIEFQNFLAVYPYSLQGDVHEKEELASEMMGGIGWWPNQCPEAGRIRILRRCLLLEQLTAGRDEQGRNARRELIKSTLLNLEKAGLSVTSKLKRWPGSTT